MAEYKPDELTYWDNECAKAAKNYLEYVHQEKLFKILSEGKLAALIMELKKEFAEESNVSLEMRAKASLDWKIFAAEQIKLLKEAGRTWLKYEDAQRRWETQRSILAAKREEFKRL
jgi:hypothetical protein